MSDISKKILSIDPELGENPALSVDAPAKKEPNAPIVKPLSSDDRIPAFVSKPSPIHLSGKVEPVSKFLIWMGLTLGLLWVALSFAYLIIVKEITLASLPPLQWGEVIATTIFPAILIFLFFMACHKLRLVSVRADKLSHTSLSLLQADENASLNARNLAETVRAEISKLDKAMNDAASRLDTLHTISTQHSDLISEKTSSLLSVNETVKTDMNEQKNLLDDITQTTETRLNSLSSHLKTQQNQFSDMANQSSDTLVKVNADMAETLSQFEIFTQKVETRIQDAVLTLQSAEGNTENMLQALTEKSKNLQIVVEDLSQKNQALEVLMKEHFEALTNLSEKNEKVNSEFSQTVANSLKISETLKSELSTHQTAIKAEKQNLEAGKQAQEIQLAASLSQAQQALAEIETKLSRLESGAQALEGQRLAHAETPPLPFSETPQLDVSPPSLAGSRVHLKPLEDEFEADLNFPEGETDLMPFADDTSDLMRPIDDRPAKLGRKKKEKSAWRWRDLMGGFDHSDIDSGIDSDDISAEEAPNTSRSQDAETSPPPTPKRFNDWLSDIGVNAEAVVSDGTVLDVAAAMSVTPDTSQALLLERLSGVVEHFHALSQETPELFTTAKSYCKEFEETLNPQIMNKQAIRARLDSSEGKTYLLARLLK